ncbi:hypothetical protein IAQ61_004484 [Plenodomus lingam]|uniref:uncharacterized protein n=1 Tax=Leptosphaeria maculans TaxID=5022 RepID=UPI00332AFE67|nr:hypothetical protein IAQ61_004484 [Plenodomus lingam]
MTNTYIIGTFCITMLDMEYDDTKSSGAGLPRRRAKWQAYSGSSDHHSCTYTCDLVGTIFRSSWSTPAHLTQQPAAAIIIRDGGSRSMSAARALVSCPPLPTTTGTTSMSTDSTSAHKRQRPGWA